MRTPISESPFKVWRLSTDTKVTVLDSKAFHVCECDDEEDAAFIVEACNAHDALSAENARLREALNLILTAQADGAVSCNYSCGKCTACRCEQARAALAGGEKRICYRDGESLSPVTDCDCDNCNGGAV